MVSGMARVVATAGVWIGVVLVMVGASTFDLSEFYATLTILIIMSAGAYSTKWIWEQPAPEAAESEREKAKRKAGSKARRLLEALDEDDIAELRARLGVSETSSDGEIIPLDTLLREERRRKG